MRAFVLTAAALICFAANSILCRMALGGRAIDPASFSTIRLVSGALALALLAGLRGGRIGARPAGSWLSAVMLFLYAVPFALAYRSLGVGSGALILFGSVQLTMIASALRSGERPHSLEWGGWFVALAGLIYLVSPGLSAPAPGGSILMTIAGIAWGVYSLRGRSAADPLRNTAGNFARTVPLALVLGAIGAAAGSLHASARGWILAAASGVLASGLGYTVWYTALATLTATRAATVQLCVPVLSALGGVLFLSERIGLRLIVATVMVLCGVGLAVKGRQGSNRAAAAAPSGVSSLRTGGAA